MVQVAKSKLAAKYGAKLDSAVRASADTPVVERGFRNAPPGITDGRIQITECFFEEQTKDTKATRADGTVAVGEYIFKAVGIIQDDFDNLENAPTKGIQVRLGNGFGISCFDVKRASGEIVTQQAQIDEIMNYFKLWGLDTAGAGGNELEGLAAAIQEAQPFVKFWSTKAKKPSADGSFRTWENWGKADPDYVPPDASSSVQDNTGASPTTKPSSGNGKPTTAAKQAPAAEPPFGDGLDDLAVDCASDDTDVAADATAKMAKFAKAEGIDHESPDYPDWAAVAEAIRQARKGGGSDAVDLDALGAAADTGDQEAADKLDELRQAAGMSDDDYNGMGWVEVADWIKSQGGASAVTVETGTVYGYKVDPKGKPVDCEVLSVKDGKVTLKNLTTGKTVMDVKTKKPLLINESDLIAS